MTTSQLSEWHPPTIVADNQNSNEVWVLAARAIKAQNQSALDEALALAHSTYTPLGYRIVVRGYEVAVEEAGMQLPPVS